MSKDTQRGDYMLKAMNRIHLSGDSYTDIQTLYNNCIGYSKNSSLQEDLMYLCANGTLTIDDGKVSTTYISSCELNAAHHLAKNQKIHLLLLPPQEKLP